MTKQQWGQLLAAIAQREKLERPGLDLRIDRDCEYRSPTSSPSQWDRSQQAYAEALLELCSRTHNDRYLDEERKFWLRWEQEREDAIRAKKLNQ